MVNRRQSEGGVWKGQKDLGLRIEVAVLYPMPSISQKTEAQQFHIADLVCKCRTVVSTLAKNMAEYFGMFELGSANMGRKRVDVGVGTIGQGDFHAGSC
jgi:hypothetical protein